MPQTDMALGLAVLAVLGAATYQRLYESPPAARLYEPPPTARVTVNQEPRAPARIDKAPRKQAQRQKLIADLIYWGVFQRVETISPMLVHVYVKPEAFNKLRFEVKQSYLSVVFTARFDNMSTDKAVHVFDATNNKHLGYYSSALRGLYLN
jgi:hypothetical protein